MQPALLADVAEGDGSQFGGGVALGPGLLLGPQAFQRLQHRFKGSKGEFSERCTTGGRRSMKARGLTPSVKKLFTLFGSLL